ncbi:DUF6879 family protein [Streptomyces sp. NPDC005438]|uniref:DUF6879 family protein n=1 Tax=Streptomyces sp. NPDC005438 TaxID=3156880 RepID=UPI0033A10414
MRPPARSALAEARQSAVHIELRDGYMADDPGFLAWRDGVRLDPADRGEWWGGWHDAVADAVARGVEVRRVRVVSEPLSDYVRYEYDVTFTNLAAGEQVRWLPRRRASRLLLPATDGWVFDRKLALLHHFTGDGQLAEDGREYVEEATCVQRFADAVEEAWDLAVPHEDYRPV